MCDVKKLSRKLAIESAQLEVASSWKKLTQTCRSSFLSCRILEQRPSSKNYSWPLPHNLHVPWSEFWCPNWKQSTSLELLHIGKDCETRGNWIWGRDWLLNEINIVWACVAGGVRASPLRDVRCRPRIVYIGRNTLPNGWRGSRTLVSGGLHLKSRSPT